MRRCGVAAPRSGWRWGTNGKVLLLTFGLWSLYFWIATVGSSLIDLPRSGDIMVRRAAGSLVGVGISWALYLLMRRRSPKGFPGHLFLLATLGAFGGMVHMVAHYMIFHVAGGVPGSNMSPAAWIAMSIYWTWFFLFWSACVLVLLYQEKITSKEGALVETRLAFDELRHSLEQLDNGFAASPRSNANDLWATDRKGSVRVPLQDVVWFEACGDYVLAHLPHREHLLSESMRKLEARLDRSIFMRVHRGAIVRKDAICAVERMQFGAIRLQLANGGRVPVSRTYKKLVQQLVRLAMTGNGTVGQSFGARAQ